MSDSDIELEISCQEVKRRLDEEQDLLLLDCRETQEHELVAIEGAQLLPMSELTERYGELDGQQERPLIVYCHHGGRSLQVANWLRGQGFGKAQSMQGGIDVWAQEIEPGMVRY